MSKDEIKTYKDAKKKAIDLIKEIDSEDDNFIVITAKDGEVKEMICCDDMTLATVIHKIIQEDDGIQKLMEYIDIKQRERIPFGDMLRRMAGLDNDDE